MLPVWWNWSSYTGRHSSEGANKVSEEKKEKNNYAFVLNMKSSNGSSGVYFVWWCAVKECPY